MSRACALISFILMLSISHAQVIESHIDFTISPGTIVAGKIQYAQEWLNPAEFESKELSVVDTSGISKTYSGKNQLVVAKVAFISKKSFNQLSSIKMNNVEFISKMLDTVSLNQISLDSWRATNKVKAYGLPFKISFDLRLKEVTHSSLGAAGTFLINEASGIRYPGQERFMTLDMNNFTMLMYRNYAVIYMKEISSSETMVIAGIVAGIDIDKAGFYFPFGARAPMMNNLKTQVMNMVRNIQKAE